jgi:hypothetical protein
MGSPPAPVATTLGSVPWWRLALLVPGLLYLIWNTGWYAYSAASGKPVRVLGASEESGGPIVLGPGGRTADTVSRGTRAWWAGFASSALPLGVLTGGVFFWRARARRQATVPTPPSTGVRRPARSILFLAYGGFATLVGGWNVFWCLIGLVSGASLRIAVSGKGDGGMLVMGPGGSGDSAARPGDGLWWMAFVFGLIVLALGLVALTITRRLASAHTDEERRAALTLSGHLQTVPHSEEETRRFQLLWAAIERKGRRVIGALVGGGFALMVAAVGVLLASHTPSDAAINLCQWTMGCGAVLLASALVYSIVALRCPACEARIGTLGSHTHCPHCDVQLRPSPGGKT